MVTNKNNNDNEQFSNKENEQGKPLSKNKQKSAIWHQKQAEIKAKREIAERRRLILANFERLRTSSAESASSTLSARSSSEPRADGTENFIGRHKPKKKDKRKNSNKARAQAGVSSCDDSEVSDSDGEVVPTEPRVNFSKIKGFMGGIDLPSILFGSGLPIKIEDKTLSTMVQIAKTLREAAPTNDERSSLVNSVNKLVSTVDQIKDKSIRDNIKSVTDDIINSAQTSMKDVCKDMFLLTLLAGSSVHFARTRDVKSGCILVAAGALVYFYSDAAKNSNFLQSLETWCSKVNFNNEATAEIGVEDINHCSTGVTLLVNSYVAYVTGKDVPFEMLKNLSTFDRTKKSLSEIMQFFYGFFEKVVNWIRREFMDLPSMRFLSANDALIDKYFEETARIYELQRDGKFFNNEYSYGKVYELVKTGRRLYMDLPKDQCTIGARQLLRDDLQRMEKLKKEFEDSHIDLKGFRMETVGVMLRGGPRTGKSIVMNHICHAFLASILDDDKYKEFQANPSDFVYNRFAETVYWDKYSLNSMVCMFDDFGQARDVQGTPDNEIMNFIRAVNCFRYDLHMAHLDEKGLTAFNSKLAIATTNLFNWQLIESICDTNALQGRIALDVVVCPRREFCTLDTLFKEPRSKKFDKKYLPEDSVQEIYTYSNPGGKVVSNAIHPDMQEFHVLDSDHCYTGEILDFKGMVTRIVELYKRNMAWYLNQKLAIKKTEAMFRQVTPNEFGYIQMEEAEVQSGAYEDKIPDILASYFDTQETSSDSTLENENFTSLEDSVRNFPEEIRMATLMEAERIKTLPVDVRDSKIRFVRNLARAIYFNEAGFLDRINVWTLFAHHLHELKAPFAQAYFGNVVEKRAFVNRCEVMNPLLIPFILPEEVLPEIEHSRSNLEKFRSKVKELWIAFKEHPIVEMLLNGLKKLKPLIIGVTVVVAAIGVTSFTAFLSISYIKTFIKFIFPTFDGFSQSGDYLENQKNGKKQVRTPAQIRAANRVGKAQVGGDDSNGRQLIKKMVKTNLYSMKVQLGPERWSDFGSIFFIGDTVAVVPHHFSVLLQSHIDKDVTIRNYKIQITGFGTDGKANVGTCTIGYFVDHIFGENLAPYDLSLCIFSRHTIQPRMNRMDCIATVADIQKVMTRKLNFILPRLDESSMIEYREGNANVFDHEWLVNLPTGDNLTVRAGFHYQGFTQAGDCGAPFCILNSSIQKRKIYGFHTSGKPDGTSFASLCTREMLEDALNERVFPNGFVFGLASPEVLDKPINEVTIADGVMEPTDPRYEKETKTVKELMVNVENLDDIVTEAQGITDIAFEQFNVFGKAEKGPAMCTNSKIVRSRLFNTYTETDLRPAMLRIREDINPMVQALSKYCKNHTYIDPTIFNKAAMNWIEGYIDVRHTQIKAKILTVWEAVYGIEGSPYFKGIPKHTSSGYPMNISGVEDLKKGLFPAPKSQDRKDDPDHKFWTLHDLVMIDIDKMKQGIRPVYMFTDFLKDELRPKEKAAAGKTRLISGSPLVYTIINRMYCQAFEVELTTNKIFNNICVGINPYSSDWHTLIQQLSKYHHSAEEAEVGDGDFTGFDGGQLAAFQLAVLFIYQWWYTCGRFYDSAFAEQCKIRAIIWMEVTNPRHINNAVIYEWIGALSSGHGSTVFINSLINCLLFRACWMMIMGYTLNFNIYVFLATYGDDVLFTVHGEFRGKFNNITVSEAMSWFGMVYTTGDKSKATLPFRRITEVEFLKRGFYFHPLCYEWVAPLRLDVVLNIPMWTKKCSFKNQIVADNVVVAIRELALHPSTVFNEWRPKICDAYMKMYPEFDIHSMFIQAQIDIWHIIRDDFRIIDAPDEVDLTEDSHYEVLDWVKGKDLYR